MIQIPNDYAKRRVLSMNGTDRLQISLSSGYDPKIVEAWFQICPLEVLITESTEVGFSVIVNSPPGIAVSVLPIKDCNRNFYANIDDDIYSRLQLPRRKGFSVRISIRSDVSDSCLLNDEPIVIKPFREDQMIIAATKVWEINRGNKNDDLVPVNPHDVPPPLVDLAKILDECVPELAEDVAYFRRRLNNVLETFAWYSKSILANSVREFLVFNSAKLNDLILQCQRKERELKRVPEWNGVFVSELFKKLSPQVPNDVLESAKQASIAAADAVCEPKNFSDVDTTSGKLPDVVSMVDLFATPGLPGIERVKSVLRLANQHEIPLHQCGRCNSNATYIKSVRNDAAGNKVDIWHVSCTGCSHSLSRDKWHASPFFVGFLWNKDNEGEYPINQAPGFKFEGLEFLEVSKCLKDFNNVFNHISVKVRDTFKNDPSLDSSDAETRLMAAGGWASYIAHCIKLINIKRHGKK